MLPPPERLESTAEDVEHAGTRGGVHENQVHTGGDVVGELARLVGV